MPHGKNFGSIRVAREDDGVLEQSPRWTFREVMNAEIDMSDGIQ